MRKRSFEESYQLLQKLGGGPMTDEAIEGIRQAISGRTSLLTSMAVDIAARRGLYGLIPDIIAAFERFVSDGSATDKGCSAKTSIVNALNKLEFMGDSVFLVGATYIQIEPAYGGPIDTAVQVRAGAAFGLARIEHPDACFVLEEMLLDPQPGPRAAAARALGYLGRPESELLLRFKVMVGDTDAEVIRECFDCLMSMSPERSLDFVARSLRSNDDAIAQYVALAIGGARQPRVYERLRECWEEFPSPSRRRMLLLPIALVRSEEAFDFLLGVLRTADPKTAVQAVPALRVCTPTNCAAIVQAVVESRSIPELTSVFKESFD